MPEIPRRTLVTMMNALSSGVVPRRGLEYIAVGRKKEAETFLNDLDDTAEGGGAFRIISGRYGNGKSFMVQMVRNHAMDKGFVVMDADLAIDRRLTGSKNEGLNTYRALVTNMAIKARPDGGSMESILQEWGLSIRDTIAEENSIDPECVPTDDVVSRIRKITADMNAYPYYNDFAVAVAEYWREFSSGDERMDVLKWFKGEYDRKSDARSEIGVNTIINDDNWYDFIKLWAAFVKRCGYKGMVVFLDEGVVLYKIQNKISRSKNYERILTIFNDIMQGKSAYLSMYMCGTPEFIEDEDRGLYSYEALRSRLTGGKFGSEYDNYLGPVVNLRPLTNEQIFVLLNTLKEMHESRYDYVSEIDDDKLSIYMSKAMSAMGASKLVTPRELTRDFISLLDALKQNPDTTFDMMVKDRKVGIDVDPDGLLDLIDI